MSENENGRFSIRSKIQIQLCGFITFNVWGLLDVVHSIVEIFLSLAHSSCVVAFRSNSLASFHTGSFYPLIGAKFAFSTSPLSVPLIKINHFIHITYDLSFVLSFVLWLRRHRPRLLIFFSPAMRLRLILFIFICSNTSTFWWLPIDIATIDAYAFFSAQKIWCDDCTPARIRLLYIITGFN